MICSNVALSADVLMEPLSEPRYKSFVNFPLYCISPLVSWIMDYITVMHPQYVRLQNLGTVAY